jgi:hypothetical protein
MRPFSNSMASKSAQSHDVRALNLIPQVVWVDDGATFESRQHAQNLDYAAISIDRDLGASRDVSRLLESTAYSKAMARGFYLPPAELLSGCFKTARSRSFFRFFRRNSSGSMFTMWASSSIKDSRAK